VLRGVGRILAAAVAGAEVAGRIGGEEFLLVLPGSGLAQALGRAEQVRAAAEAARHEVPGALLTATLSLGVAEMDAGDLSAGDLLGRADKALYQAKGEGRNRVCS
jgi:diguanylate cyclase (GGDEF)-like protein